MNIKWMSLVAAMAVLSVGCSDKDQDADQGYSSNETNAAVQTEQENLTESTAPVETKETGADSETSSEKLDEDVKQLVEKLTEGHEGADAEKLGQDIKGVLKQIEADEELNP